MTDGVNPEIAMKMATDIVIAYLGNRTVEPEQLPQLVRHVRAALTEDAADMNLAESAGSVATTKAESSNERRPAVPVGESITSDFLISLEDGKRYRSLKRHLMARYGMTPADYRARWGLPDDYPMVAPSYAADRSEVAKRIGLGKDKATANVPKGKLRGKRKAASA